MAPVSFFTAVFLVAERRAVFLGGVLVGDVFLLEDVFTTGVPRKIISDNAENISAGSLPHLYNSINQGFQDSNQNIDNEEAKPKHASCHAEKHISEMAGACYYETKSSDHSSIKVNNTLAAIK